MLLDASKDPAERRKGIATKMIGLALEECRKLGWRAAAHCDLLVIVNRYNREAILEGAREGGMDENNIICADTLAQAVALMQPFATPGSVVLYENDLPDTFR